MSNKKERRRSEKEKRLEQERKLRRKRRKQIVGAVIGVSLLAGLVWLGSNVGPPYDWTQCFNGPPLQHTHFGLFMQVGERAGALNVSFIRIPENLGLKRSCMYPMHTHTASTPGERGVEYTKIHVEAPNNHAYTLDEFFSGWSEWMVYPADIYFQSDGISYYRTLDFEMVVEKDSDLDGNFDSSARVFSYGAYVPQDGDGIRLIVHEPFMVVPGPYPGGEMPIVADFTSTRVSGQTFAFYASASGGNAPYTFEWNFVDGTAPVTTTDTSIVHTFTTPGEHLVVLRVRDASGTLVMVRHIVQA